MFAAQVIFDGDSRTQGFGAVDNAGYVQQLEAEIGKIVDIKNVAVFGDTASHRKDVFDQTIKPIYNPTIKKHILLNAAGVNDLGGGHKPAKTVYAALVGWTKKALALGPNIKVYLFTVPPIANASPEFEDQRKLLNKDILDNNAHVSYSVIDLAGDGVVGDGSKMLDKSYSEDGIHWTAQMAKQVAKIVIRSIRNDF